jgi:hypothetical protein
MIEEYFVVFYLELSTKNTTTDEVKLQIELIDLISWIVCSLLKLKIGHLINVFNG